MAKHTYSVVYVSVDNHDDGLAPPEIKSVRAAGPAEAIAKVVAGYAKDGAERGDKRLTPAAALTAFTAEYVIHCVFAGKPVAGPGSKVVKTANGGADFIC